MLAPYRDGRGNLSHEMDLALVLMGDLQAKIAELEQTIKIVADHFGADISDILNEEAE